MIRGSKLVSKCILLGAVLSVGCAGASKNSNQSSSAIPTTTITCSADIKVVGISTRTTNQNGQSLKDVEKLWKRFWAEKISTQIVDKVNEDIYAVYTDYDHGDSENYTVLIGYPVSSLSNRANGFMGKELTTGLCKKYISKGKMPEAIVKTWNEIWQDNQLKRAYSTDFTIHGKKYYDGENAEVETYIFIEEE